MLFWRCLVGVLLFWLALLVLSFADMVEAEPFYQQYQVDPRARVFMLCVDRLQLDIELGLKPDLTDEQALQICSDRTETVLESLSNNGLEQASDTWGPAF